MFRFLSNIKLVYSRIFVKIGRKVVYSRLNRQESIIKLNILPVIYFFPKLKLSGNWKTNLLQNKYTTFA